MNERPEELRTLLLSIRRHKLFIAAFTLIACAAAGLWSLTIEPSYQATAVVSVAQSQAGRTGIIAQILGAVPSAGANYKAILVSRKLAADVRDSLRLEGKIKTKDGVVPKDQIPMLLQSKISVDAAEPGILKISYSSPTPEIARDVANAYVDALNDYVVENSALHATKYRRFVEKQLAKTEQELTSSEDTLKAFLQQNKMLKVDSELQEKVAKHNGYLLELESSDLALTAVKSKIDSYSEINPDKTVPVEILADSPVGVLRSQLLAKEMERAMLLQTWNDSHPRVLALQKDIDEIKTKLFAHIRLSSDNQIASLQVEKISLEAKKSGLNKLLSALDAELSSAPELTQKYIRIERKASTLSDLFKMLLTEYENARIEERKQADVLSILDPALLPGAPSWPKRKFILVMAFISALIASVFIAVITDYVRVKEQ